MSVAFLCGCLLRSASLAPASVVLRPRVPILLMCFSHAYWHHALPAHSFGRSLRLVSTAYSAGLLCLFLSLSSFLTFFLRSFFTQILTFFPTFFLIFCLPALLLSLLSLLLYSCSVYFTLRFLRLSSSPRGRTSEPLGLTLSHLLFRLSDYSLHLVLFVAPNLAHFFSRFAI